MERTEEEIKHMLTLAKINVDNLHSTTQTIYFDKDLSNQQNLKLLEINDHLYDCLKQGQPLYIKGEDEENAVLCTDTRTYDLVETETSNSLLIAKNVKFDDDLKLSKESISSAFINNIHYGYLEAVPGKPYLKKLKNLLQSTAYKGPEYEFEITERLYTYSELLNVVQASKDELNNAFKSLSTITIDNKVRILDFEYHFRVLSYMLNLIDENSWGLEDIDYEETISALSDLVPTSVLDSLFNLYAEETRIIDGVQLYKYKEREVCQFFARVLLRGAWKFNLGEFLQTWQESVPDRMITNEEMLHGIALIDRETTPNTIRELREDLLPDNILERFKALFDIKRKWRAEEISPYIECLATERMDTNALLAKYARTSNQNDVKYYSSKHN